MIQKMVVHCQRAHYDVLIDRTTKWGNPFTHVMGRTRAEFRVKTREEAIARFEEWIRTRPDLMAALPELRGKVLGCWCDPHPCHGHVLVRLANEGVEA